MSSNLLSSLHIEKLGHPIQEIRTRALLSVWSKFSLDLVDNTDSKNTKFLLKKLIEWFDFEEHPHEDKVLKLIRDILNRENSYLIINSSDNEKLSMEMEKIKKFVHTKFYPLIDNIMECFKQNEEKLKESTKDKHLLDSYDKFLPYNSSTNIQINLTELEKCKSFEKSENSNKLLFNSNKVAAGEGNVKGKNKVNSYSVKIEYFPLHTLTLNDYYYLNSMYEGLRYIDDIVSVLQFCDFYNDVILKDFPAELLLQRPLLLQTLMELLQSDESRIFIPSGICLLNTVRQLHNRLECALKINGPHSTNFYKGFIFNNFSENDDGISETDVSKYCENNRILSCGKQTIMENKEELTVIKSQQYSLPKICSSIFSYTITQISKKKTAEEYNLMYELVVETFFLLANNVKSNISNTEHHFKNDLNHMLNLFQEPLKYHKDKSRIHHLIIVHILTKILSNFQSMEKIFHEIAPYYLQFEFAECISDHIFLLLYPKLTSKLVDLVEKLSCQRKHEVLEHYRFLLSICKSIKSAVKILKNTEKLKTKIQTLNHIDSSMFCLELHRNFEIIQYFVENCLIKWSDKSLKKNEIDLRKKILIKLLAHSDEEVKTFIYKILFVNISEIMGNAAYEKPNILCKGNNLSFLFDSEILNEIICHGLNSSSTQIQNYSSEIFIYILKGKVFFNDEVWQKFLNVLTSCLPLLECYADKSTPLGICILKILDPDISRSILLPPLDLIRGNIRLLFSKNHLVREEALLRLFWLLNKEDPNKKKLPQLNLLRELNLNSICSSVLPQEYFYPGQSFYASNSLINVIEMLNEEKVEPSVRRSALSQLSVMLECSNLHSKFIEMDGLQTILNILKNCLVKEQYHNYPDSVVPIMNILKLICLYNPSVRVELSQDADIYYCALRGLLLFNSERQSRQQGVVLLCLLLYSDYIINVHDERTQTYKISLPELLIKKICLPFPTEVYGKYSKYSEPSIRESIMLRKQSASLVRVYWGIQWLGSIPQILTLPYDDLKHTYSSSIPSDMILTPQDIELLKDCSLVFRIPKTLYDIQNATTHEAVIASLHILNTYLFLFEVGTGQGEVENLCIMNDGIRSLEKFQWDKVFGRFFIASPSCKEDEIVLIEVIRTIRLLLRILKSQYLFAWSVNLLTDESGTLSKVLKSYRENDSDLTGRSLNRVITGLIKDVVRSTEYLNRNWQFYISMITRLLKLKCNDDLNDLAHFDWFTSILVDVTGRTKLVEINLREYYKETITIIMEILLKYHCSKDFHNSFMGLNVIKNCLYILNNLLADMQSIKDWEFLWYDALSNVIGHSNQTNYCWLLSLWFVRDPVVRALAIQLFAGFSLSSRSCELLIEKLHIEFGDIWNEGFRLLLNDNECSLIKEKAAVLLSNLTCYGSVTTAPVFLQYLSDNNFYKILCDLLERLSVEPVLNDETNYYVERKYSQYVEAEDATVLSMSTPSLIGAVSVLLVNIMFLNPEEVMGCILRNNLLEYFTKLFYEASETCLKYMNKDHKDHILCLLKMYINCCKVINKTMTTNSAAYRSILRSQQFINALYCLLNYSIYDSSSKVILDYRNQLWCEILDLFSIVLIGSAENELLPKEGFKALNHMLTENGTDYFVSSLYLAVSSDSGDLRTRCLNCLVNLFGLEANMKSDISISDILERDISLDCMEEAIMFSWKALSICKQPDLKFAKGVSDVLLQSYKMFDYSDHLEFKILVPNALIALLGVSRSSQNFCLKYGLLDVISENLRKSFTKINLENVDSFRKASKKKRIDSILRDVETSYRLLSNLSNGNEKVKEHVAHLGLCSLLCTFWPWCTFKNTLIISILKFLCTYSYGSVKACRSMAIDKSCSSFCVSKSPGAAAVINLVLIQIGKEMDLLSKSQDFEVLRLLFQVLENCCAATECRSIIAKGALFSHFNYYGKGYQSRLHPQNDEILQIWFNFFFIFTSYQEGQLALVKNQDVLQTVIRTTSSSNFGLRKKALQILMKISFHQLNRFHLLNNYGFLSIMLDTLKSGEPEEINLVLHALWSLTGNFQKGKFIIRTSGFENVLMETKKKLKLSNESLLPIINIVLQILQNK